MPMTRNQTNAASQARLAAANSSETSTSKETNDQGGTSAEGEPPRRDSPENCSICLGPFNNKSFTSSCAHSFCFVCLKQWSKVKAECPLCKQPFTSIFHNIRSNQHYDIYELPHQPVNPVDYNSIFNYVSGPIPSFTGPTHHLFSLSQPAFDADLTLSNFSRFQFRHRRYDRYLNPLGIHGEHPYSFTGSSINPGSHISAATWPRGAEEFRRDVYRRNLGPPAVILGCENSTYRLTPAMVAASAHRIHRIMPWLTRELRVLLRSHQNVRLAISIIQPLLTQVTIDSMFFYEKIASLIGRRSRQFVQEFVAFANSALSLQAYDRKAMYRRRDVVSAVPSSSSNSSSENDVVEVTDISPEVFPNPSAPGPSQTQPLNLSRSGWDSPIPGPSWDSANTTQESAVDRVSVSSESDDPVFRPDLRDSDSDESRAGSDIIFVKYDKPWNERSPINLTSDSDKNEGNDSSRKKKKSKHKKKKKEAAYNGEVCGSKKDKGKKSSSKSKHKDKSKSSSKAVISDEERESTEVRKRRHSQSSVEHHKGKKHKKSKSKKEKLSDREIVDRYFAKAISQEKDDNSSESEELEVSTSAKHQERSSSKEKSKKKKKNRKHSKDSRNQSHRPTYKKHHSGHKKSSSRMHEGLPEQHNRHTHSPVRQTQLVGPSRSDVVGNDNLTQQEPSSSTMSHPVVPGFQPPFLGMADTVQHIPVNLWVSAWPTLSVSHTYPPPPPPIAMGTGIPQSSNTSSSTTTSNPTCTGEPNRAHMDRLSISSDSSSDSSDSDDDVDDDAQDLQIPSLQNVHSRTKQWLETNFPDLGRPQTSSTSVSNNVNTTVSSDNGHKATSTVVIGSSSNLPDRSETVKEREAVNKEKENDFVEVVSIASEDEDVVVCSSEDGCSNVGDLWVIDVDNANKNNVSNSIGLNMKSGASGSCHISTFPFSNGNVGQESAASSSSGPSNIILPPVNKSFQPFKLQKRPAMSISGNDPFFPPMTHSSDEDGEVNNMVQDSSCKTKPSYTDEPTASQSNELSTVNSFGDLTNILQHTKESMCSSPQSSKPPRQNLTSLPLNTQITSLSVTTTSFTTATSSMFSALAPLTSSSHTTKPTKSSSISYLPYANLPPPAPVSSILPFTSQSTLPPPPSPLSLPLPFPPFPQIPLLSTSSQSTNSVLPSLYTPQSQATSSTSLKYSSEVTGEDGNHSIAQPLSEKVNAKAESFVQLCNQPKSIGQFKDKNCIRSEKGDSELSSSDHVLTLNNVQDGAVNSPQLVENGTLHDKRIPMETDIEVSNPCHLNTHQYFPVFENDLLPDVVEEHKENEITTVGSTFPGNARKKVVETLKSTTVDVFTSLLKDDRLVDGEYIESQEETSVSDSADNHILPTSNSQFGTNCEELNSDAVLSACSTSTHNVLSTSFAQSANDQPFYSLNAGVRNSDIAVNSTNNKPFDALDDSSSNDVPMPMGPSQSVASVSNIMPEETSTVTTLPDRVEPSVLESTLQPSFVTSLHPAAKPQTVCGHLYNSETSLPVFKPYSDGSDQTLEQFTDALASSESDNDT